VVWAVGKEAVEGSSMMGLWSGDVTVWLGGGVLVGKLGGNGGQRETV
jgi:hypothetical protein